MRYKTNEGEDGEILQGGDGLWMHPDDPARDPLQLHGADGRPLDSEPRRYSATTPEFCEEFLAEAKAWEKECIDDRCEEMGLTPGQRTPVIRVFALMMVRQLAADWLFEILCHHERSAASRPPAGTSTQVPPA